MQAVASLHPGAPAARQGGEPARHRVRARGDQPARDAGARSKTAGARIEALQTELEIIAREAAVGVEVAERDSRASTKLLSEEQKRLQELEARWKTEKGLVDRILELRAQLRKRAAKVSDRTPAGRAEAERDAARRSCSVEPQRRDAPSARARSLLASCAGCKPSCAAAGRSAADPAQRRRAGRRVGRRRLDRHPRRADGEERDRDRAQARRQSRARASSASATGSR